MGDCLREKISIHYAKSMNNGIADFSEEGTLYKNGWARDMSTTSKSIFLANANNQEQTRKFKVRYDRNIIEGMKIKHNGSAYEIIGVSDDQENYHSFMYLICKKVIHIES